MKPDTESDELLNELFHGCALAAFVDQAVAEGGPPDSEAVRKRAYRYYEQSLTDKQRERREA